MEWIMDRMKKQAMEFYGAETLFVFYETRPEIIERILPPPLKPASRLLVTVLLANYPSTNMGITYLESALFVSAAYNNEEGLFTLSMPVTNDMALIGGREINGYPKKMADIEFKRTGKVVSGWTERRGISFMELKANLTGKYKDNYAEEVATRFLNPPMDIVMFNVKSFARPERTSGSRGAWGRAAWTAAGSTKPWSAGRTASRWAGTPITPTA